MPLLTLGEAKTSTLRDVAGSCPESSQFLALVNEATRILMRRGNWFGTVQKLRGCVYNKCITWGPRVGTVLRMTACNNYIPVKDNWAQFEPMDQSDYLCALQCRNQNVLVNDGATPVFNQIECSEGMYIRIYPTQPSDIGKVVTLYGVDINGQTISSVRDDGTFQDGLEVIIATPYASTQKAFRRVTRVLKAVTDGPIRLYQYDLTNDVLKDMAYYERWETAPNYRHTVLGSSRRCFWECK